MVNQKVYRIIFLIIFFCTSCTKVTIGDVFNDNSKIKLKWFPAYSDDSFQKNKIALEWCLSYLGATIAEQEFVEGIVYENPIITINVKQLGFNENAVNQLTKLQDIFKKSEEYKVHNAFDLGKYIALTLGSSNHYYKIVDTPENIDFYTTNYHYNQLKGYINNSAISLPNIHRIVSYSTLSNNKDQAFIAREINPTTQETKEFEAFERMPNGQLKFAVYNEDGFLVANSKSAVSNAGKPAKCIWCHEVVIQPLYTQQANFNGYLSYFQLRDTLTFYNSKLQSYQDNIWQNPNIQNKTLHTNMELSYISYMEPSSERLSKEWNISKQRVKELLTNIPTHVNSEFSFLGTLYHRKDVDSFAPHTTIKPPGSIREESFYEPNLIE